MIVAIMKICHKLRNVFKMSVNKELSNVLLKVHINIVDFTGTFISVLNKHVPENKNTRANNAKFVNKILRES